MCIQTNKDPPKDKLVRAKVGSRNVIGVVLDEMEHGYPAGTFRMENVVIDEVSKSRILGESDKEWREGQTEEAYQKTRDNVLSIGHGKRKAEDEEIKLKGMPPPKRVRKHDSDSSVDFLNFLPTPGGLKFPKTADDGEGADDEETKPRQRKRPAPLNPDSSEAKRAKVQKGKKPAKVQAQLDKQLREVQSAEQVVLEANQLIQCATSSVSSFRTLTEASVNTTLKKMNTRLKPELLEIYTYVPSDTEELEGEVPDFAPRGIEALSNLTSLQDKVKVIIPVVQAMNATKEPYSTAFHLQSVIQAARNVIDDFSCYPMEVLLRRACKEATDKKDWAGLALILDSEEPLTDDVINIHACIPNAEIRAALQEKQITMTVHSTLRGADADAKSKSLALVTALSAIATEPSVRGLGHEINLLAQCLKVASDPALVVDVEELKKAKDTLKKGKFQKAIELFPVSTWMMTNVCDYIAACDKDRELG